MKSVRLRFAPSPTGYLHVGGARTALYNYLFSKKKKGNYILRIEDTDEQRSSKEFLKDQMRDLKWLGLCWNEGYEKGGKWGPYLQSKRRQLYQNYADQLISEKKAYYCFMTDEDILDQKRKQKERKDIFQAVSPYRNQNITKTEAEKRGLYTVRFKIKEKKEVYTFFDEIRKEVKFPSDMVGDFVLIRSNGMPVYNFCCVIDDHKMAITHAFRSEEHLSNTLKQLMIYEAFGWTPPRWVHLSIILGDNRQKLSKRHGAVSCHEMRSKGYLPEALNNTLALLGWSHPEGKEVLDKKELIESFSLERLQASPAVFDLNKLNFLNSQHLWHSGESQDKIFTKKILPFFKEIKNIEFKKINPSYYETTVNNKPFVLRSEMFVDTCKAVTQTLQQVYEVFEIITKENLELDKNDDLTKEVLSWPETKNVIYFWKEELSGFNQQFFSKESFLEVQKKIQNTFKIKGKKLFMPLRLSILGRPQGFEIKEIVPLIEISKLKAKAQYVAQYL